VPRVVGSIPPPLPKVLMILLALFTESPKNGLYKPSFGPKLERTLYCFKATRTNVKGRTSRLPSLLH